MYNKASVLGDMPLFFLFVIEGAWTKARAKGFLHVCPHMHGNTPRAFFFYVIDLNCVHVSRECTYRFQCSRVVHKPSIKPFVEKVASRCKRIT